MSRILLVIPTNRYKYAYPFPFPLTAFPTGFAYLASALRDAGHEVFGLNLNNIFGYSSAYEMLHDKIGHSLSKVQPDLVGLGGLCTDYKFIKDATQLIRKSAPNIPIVYGGGIINHDAEYIFKLLQPDFCIIGEGEEVIVQLVNALKNGNTNFKQIPNLGYWKDDKAQFTELNYNYSNIDNRAFPDYEPFGIKELLDNHSLTGAWLYHYTRPYPRPMVIVTARGCPFNCTFCIHQRGAKYRARSIENILQEISSIYKQYEFNSLVILDELFAVNKPKMREFCTALLEAKEAHKWDFDWLFQTHPSASLDLETLELAKKAGCYFLAYGLESASPRVLASMNKRTKMSQIIEAIKAADAAGIGFGGNFIFGDLAETEETISETMEFFSQYCQGVHISLGGIAPYPGSKLFEDCEKRGIIHDKFKFYEKIDESVWNMTSIPNRLWHPWIHCLGLLVGSLMWLKTTNATYYEIEANSVIGLRAECPYCGKESYHRESTKTTGRIKPSPLKLLGVVLETIIFYLLSPKHSFLKTLKPILADRRLIPFIAIGCPECGKRFKINLPNGKSPFKKRLLFECVWRLIK